MSVVGIYITLFYEFFIIKIFSKTNLFLTVFCLIVLRTSERRLFVMLSIDFSNSFLAQLDLPVSPKNTNLNTELLLSLLIDMTESTTDGYRVRAEIHFARGNFLAAMQVTIIYNSKLQLLNQTNQTDIFSTNFLRYCYQFFECVF